MSRTGPWSEIGTEHERANWAADRALVCAATRREEEALRTAFVNYLLRVDAVGGVGNTLARAKMEAVLALVCDFLGALLDDDPLREPALAVSQMVRRMPPLNAFPFALRGTVAKELVQAIVLATPAPDFHHWLRQNYGDV